MYFQRVTMSPVYNRAHCQPELIESDWLNPSSIPEWNLPASCSTSSDNPRNEPYSIEIAPPDFVCADPWPLILFIAIDGTVDCCQEWNGNSSQQTKLWRSSSQEIWNQFSHAPFESTRSICAYRLSRYVWLLHESEDSESGIDQYVPTCIWGSKVEFESSIQFQHNSTPRDKQWFLPKSVVWPAFDRIDDIAC